MPPNSGYHLSLFANYTLDGVKATVAIAIDSQTGSPCGGWDDKTARALSHVAFQPFTWPVLRDTSPSYTDVKVYNGNEILFHWIFRGYRADTDLSVQQQFADEFFIRGVRQGRARLSVVVAAFSGWRVSVFSFECGGRTYAIGPNGTVIAGDSARSRFELRVTDRSSDDAVGNDADRVEFRYRDANNRIDLKCARTSVPATWLTVSHISGPTLVQTISRCRDQRARVEGPEQTEQFAQLAAAHKGWWHDAATLDPAKVGVLVTFVAGLDAGNFHIQAESKLFVREPEIVATRALAEMSHDGVAGGRGCSSSWTAGARPRCMVGSSRLGQCSGRCADEFWGGGNPPPGTRRAPDPHVRLGGRPDQLRSEQRGGHPGPHLGPSSGPGKR